MLARVVHGNLGLGSRFPRRHGDDWGRPAIFERSDVDACALRRTSFDWSPRDAALGWRHRSVARAVGTSVRTNASPDASQRSASGDESRVPTRSTESRSTDDTIEG